MGTLAGTRVACDAVGRANVPLVGGVTPRVIARACLEVDESGPRKTRNLLPTGGARIAHPLTDTTNTISLLVVCQPSRLGCTRVEGQPHAEGFPTPRVPCEAIHVAMVTEGSVIATLVPRKAVIISPGVAPPTVPPSLGVIISGVMEVLALTAEAERSPETSDVIR